MVSYGQCESQFLDGHHEGLPPAMAGGQGHASVGEANRGRAGGAQKRSVHTFLYLEFQKCVDFRMGLVKTEVCDKLAMASKCVK